MLPGPHYPRLTHHARSGPLEEVAGGNGTYATSLPLWKVRGALRSIPRTPHVWGQRTSPCALDPFEGIPSPCRAWTPCLRCCWPSSITAACCSPTMATRCEPWCLVSRRRAGCCMLQGTVLPRLLWACAGQLANLSRAVCVLRRLHWRALRQVAEPHRALGGWVCCWATAAALVGFPSQQSCRSPAPPHALNCRGVHQPLPPARQQSAAARRGPRAGQQGGCAQSLAGSRKCCRWRGGSARRE